MDQEWMGRCVPHFISKGKSQDQAVAACVAMYEAGDTNLEDAPAEKKPKDKYQIMADIKKLLEKNNFKCTDETLEKLFAELQESGIEMSLQKVKLDKGAEKQIIKLFPRKKVFVEKYQYKFNFDDLFFNEIIDNFENPKLFKPFGDEQHQLGIKFFDITRLFAQEDGLYAEIELNNIGMEAIRNREYSYISPQWGQRVDTEGHSYKNVLMAVTLTNIPALEGELPTLQEQIQLSRERKMEFEKRIIELSAKVGGFKLAAGEVDPMAVMKVLEEAVAMIDELKAKIVEVTGAGQAAEEAAEMAKKELSEIKAAQEKKDTDIFFESAIKDGKMLPVEESHMRKLYALDKVAVSEILNLRNGAEDSKLSANVETSTKLDKLDMEIMKERGMDAKNPAHVQMYLDAVK